MPSATKSLKPFSNLESVKPSLSYPDYSSSKAYQIFSSHPSDAATLVGSAVASMGTTPIPLGTVQLPMSAAAAPGVASEDAGNSSAFTQVPQSSARDWNAARLPQLQASVTTGGSLLQLSVPQAIPRFPQRALPHSEAARDGAAVFSPDEAAELLATVPPVYRRQQQVSDNDGTRTYRISAAAAYEIPRRRQSDSAVNMSSIFGPAGSHPSFITFQESIRPEKAAELAGIKGSIQNPVSVPRKRRLTDSGDSSLACQIADCKADLADEKPYNRRYKLCHKCIHRNSLLVDGVEMRFCQQCSFLHRISDFDGSKRSCREKLQKHALRVRKSRAAAAAGSQQPVQEGKNAVNKESA